MIVRINQHKNVQAIAVITAGPELAPTMGKFEFARWQPQHKAYWVEVQHLPTMTRVLEQAGHTVIDDRLADTVKTYAGPLPECASCGQPASRTGDRVLQRCPRCGASWRSAIQDPVASAMRLRVPCPACSAAQKPGFPRCGQCGATMPPWPPPKAAEVSTDEHVVRSAAAAAARASTAEPVPLGQTVADLDLKPPPDPDDDEEPERERYP